jgi:hypothetical protein
VAGALIELSTEEGEIRNTCGGDNTVLRKDFLFLVHLILEDSECVAGLNGSSL